MDRSPRRRRVKPEPSHDTQLYRLVIALLTVMVVLVLAALIAPATVSLNILLPALVPLVALVLRAFLARRRR